jgi:hypothetical protein
LPTTFLQCFSILKVVLVLVSRRQNEKILNWHVFCNMLNEVEDLPQIFTKTKKFQGEDL